MCASRKATKKKGHFIAFAFAANEPSVTSKYSRTNEDLSDNSYPGDDCRILTKLSLIYEPLHGKTNTLHRRKQRRRSASQSVTAKLISAFVFATRLVQCLYLQNPNHLL